MFQNSEWQLCGQQCKTLHNTFQNKPQRDPSHSAISTLVCILLHAMSSSALPSLPISLTSHLASPLLVPVRKLSQARTESHHSEICLNFNQQHRGGKMSKLSRLITEINLVI